LKKFSKKSENEKLPKLPVFFPLLLQPKQATLRNTNSISFITFIHNHYQEEEL